MFKSYNFAAAAIGVVLTISAAGPVFAAGLFGGKKPGGGTFIEKLYMGCATKQSLFSVLRAKGHEPIKVIRERDSWVVIRARSSDGLYDYDLLPCKLVIDGRKKVGR